ncbi:MAG: HlyD family efflux transporter periplasmic adaptor subunit [Limnochordales bacterium]|nr:HlyD family efflux transporter periplasmic adaptor subunit [Limnochordales bacterium]
MPESGIQGNPSAGRQEGYRPYRRSIFGGRRQEEVETGGREGEALPAHSPVRPGEELPYGQLRPRRRLSLQARLVIFTLITLAILVIVPVYFLLPREKPYILDTYQYAIVGTRDFRQIVTATGTVEPLEVISVKSPAAGLVAEVLVEPGTDVASGQVLMRLSSGEVADKRAQAERALAKATRELEKARLDQETELARLAVALEEARAALARARDQVPVLEELYRLGGISRHELEQAQQLVTQREQEVGKAQADLESARRRLALAVATAQDAVDQARKDLQIAEDMYAALIVRAPLSGKVLEVRARKGEPVQAGAELLRMADIQQMQVRGSVAADQAGALRVGQPSTVWAAGIALPARVAYVAPQATAASGQQPSTVEVIFQFTGETTPASLGVRPYTEATCEVEVGRLRDQPFLPRGPYLTSGEGGFVYVIDEKARVARRQEVVYGLVDGTAIAIREGLRPGDKVIYSSYDAFRDRREVRLSAEGGRLVPSE